jgi:uncharacterized protein (TIGR03437 family)
MTKGWLRPALLLVCASVALAQTPVVEQGGVVNAASFAAGQVVTPGSLVSIFGGELAGSLATADSIPLATQLTDVSVTFNNIRAPLLFVAPNQVNSQLPWNVLPSGQTAGAATVVVTRGGVASQPQQLQVGPFSPGIFTLQFGQGQAIAINNADGSIAAPTGSIPGFTSHPAKFGDFVIILATGLGAIDVPVANGHNSLDQTRWTTTAPAVLIGGVSVRVHFSGMSPEFVGVNQINIEIDKVVPKGGAVPLQLQVGGITSTDQVTLAIE